MINTSFLGVTEQMLLFHLEKVQSSRPENLSHLVHLIKKSLLNHKHQVLLSSVADTELWTNYLFVKKYSLHQDNYSITKKQALFSAGADREL